MTKTNTVRGIKDCETFARKFREDGFLDFYLKHKDELIIGIRDGYINLYYNCDSFLKIAEKKREPLSGVVNCNHFIPRTDRKGNGKEIRIMPEELDKKFELFKSISDINNASNEAKAQSRLFLQNDENSKWFCFDLEYMQSHKNRRFDILAISKEKAPLHKIAIIEVKYSSNALGDKSGVRKHIKDFYDFYKENGINEFRKEICSIIKSLDMLSVDVPDSLQRLSPEEIDDNLEFYIITLDNNINRGKSTPKERMGGQLFRDDRWGSKRFTTKIKTKSDYFDLINHDSKFKLTFLFSKSNLDAFNIKDIIDDKEYEREVIQVK